MDQIVHFLETSSPLVTFVVSTWALGTAYFLYLVVDHLDGRAFKTSRMRPDLEAIPGSYPLIGNLIRTIKTGDRQLETWIGLRRDQKDKTKALTVTLPTLRIIDVTNPTAIEYIQKTNFTNYVKGPLFGDVMKDALGEGIFAVDGEKWVIQRKATSKIFSSNNFRGCIMTSIEEDIATLREILGRHADSGEPFDLGALFFDFTLSSFTKMAFSQDVGSLSLDSRPPVPFAGAFDFAQIQMAKRFNNPFWKITERWTEAGKKMKDAAKVLDDFAYGIIKQRELEGLGNFTAERKTEAGNTDLLSLYMALRDDNGKPMNKRALRDAVLNLIIAGRDTTAQALSWTFYHLLTNPELMAPIRKEADETPSIDYDSYRTMKETLATFHEGLRLHPSVPKNAWQAVADDKIPNGPIIKKGDLVRWSDWELGRMTEVWGPDAGTFRPSRWIEAGEVKKESQWKFHAFNGGARLCLGQSLATLEATVVMATIVRDFDLKFAPGYLATTEMNSTEPTPRYQDSLTLPLLEPLRVVASRRKL